MAFYRALAAWRGATHPADNERKAVRAGSRVQRSARNPGVIAVSLLATLISASCGAPSVSTRPLVAPTPCARTGWTLTQPATLPQRGSLLLQSAAGDPAGAVWVVGALMVTSTEQALPIALHWSGTWSVSVLPAAIGGVPFGVSAASKHDAWAVGFPLPGAPGDASLVWRWHGVRWSFVTLPDPRWRNAALYAVADLAPDDVWVVGDTAAYPALVLHWNGAAWASVSFPETPRSYLEAIGAISANDIWVGGQDELARWDGRGWRVEPVPGVPSFNISAIAGSGPNDVWAVGHATDSNDNWHTLVLHWDGARWGVKHEGAPDSGQMMSVIAPSRMDAWISGSNDTVDSLSDRLMHWDGHVLRPSAIPAGNLGLPLLLAAAGRPWLLANTTLSMAAPIAWQLSCVPMGPA